MAVVEAATKAGDKQAQKEAEEKVVVWVFKTTEGAQKEERGWPRPAKVKKIHRGLRDQFVEHARKEGMRVIWAYLEKMQAQYENRFHDYIYR
jgi:hypothetical protein